jgi:hypothetical protein
METNAGGFPVGHNIVPVMLGAEEAECHSDKSHEAEHRSDHVGNAGELNRLA